MGWVLWDIVLDCFNKNMFFLFVFCMPISSTTSLLSPLLAAPCLEALENDNQSELINDSLWPYDTMKGSFTLCLWDWISLEQLWTLLAFHMVIRIHLVCCEWTLAFRVCLKSVPTSLQMVVNCRGTHFLGCTGAKTSAHWTEVATLTAPQKAPERFLQPLWFM